MDLYLVQVETIHLMVVVALAALEILTPTVVLVEMVVRADKSLQHLETHQIHMEEQVQVLLMDGLVAVVVDQTQPTEVLPLMDLPLGEKVTEQLLTLVEVALGQTTSPGAATINPISGHANTGGGGGGGNVIPGTPAPTGNPLGNGGSGIVMVAFDV